MEPFLSTWERPRGASAGLLLPSAICHLTGALADAAGQLRTKEAKREIRAASHVPLNDRVTRLRDAELLKKRPGPGFLGLGPTDLLGCTGPLP